MLGKASEIKTLLVLEVAGTTIHESINENLNLLKDSEIIDIRFVSTADSDGVAWFNALIIYKEVSQFET